MRLSNKVFSAALLLLLTACVSSNQAWERRTGIDTSTADGNRMLYKVGKPYQVNGKWYTPKEDLNYDEVGIASWYGAEFHNKQTANGERYDKYAFTAAHRTLPLPSMVKVTNLENGKSLVLRVNDRGPFAENRIIDVSKRAAQELGFWQKGTAKVRVQFLHRETASLFGIEPPRKNSAPAKAREVQVADLNWKLPKETETKPAAKNTNYFVRIGTFRYENNAKSASYNVRGLGDVFISMHDIKGVPHYQVNVGPLETRSDAEDLAKIIREQGFKDAFTFERRS